MNDLFYHFCTKQVGNGQRTCFWEEIWLGNVAFKFKFATLYNLRERKFISVSTVFTEGWGCFKFRRHLTGDLLSMFKEMIS